MVKMRSKPGNKIYLDIVYINFNKNSVVHLFAVENGKRTDFTILPPSTSTLLLSGASPTLWQNKFVEKGRKEGRDAGCCVRNGEPLMRYLHLLDFFI